MDDRVKAEYDSIVSKAIVKNGSLVGDVFHGGSWRDRDEWDGRNRHILSCGIASFTRIDEDAQWCEFMGTFYEGDGIVHGMDVIGVTCNCGRIINRTYRWGAPVGEAIRVVMMELLERTMGQES